MVKGRRLRVCRSLHDGWECVFFMRWVLFCYSAAFRGLELSLGELVMTDDEIKRKAGVCSVPGRSSSGNVSISSDWALASWRAPAWQPPLPQ